MIIVGVKVQEGFLTSINLLVTLAFDPVKPPLSIMLSVNSIPTERTLISSRGLANSICTSAIIHSSIITLRACVRGKVIGSVVCC